MEQFVALRTDDTKPCGHGTHAPSSTLLTKKPGKHCAHRALPRGVLEPRPGAQTLHFIAFCSFEMKPTGQSSHASSLVTKVPGMHGEQTALPLTEVRPDGQSLQVYAPG